MDSRAVPGVLLSSRALKVKEADLKDLPVSILADFGIERPPQMRGRSVF
jgi:bisphosphoglycerate-independent phosphoglycerate mutase (AlkP superfamily)